MLNKNCIILTNGLFLQAEGMQEHFTAKQDVEIKQSLTVQKHMMSNDRFLVLEVKNWSKKNPITLLFLPSWLGL